MKKTMLICALLMLGVSAGCSTEFAAGVGTGLVAALNETNKTIVGLKEQAQDVNEITIELAEETADLKAYVEARIKRYKKHPELMLELLDPNLAVAVAELKDNLTDLKTEAKTMVDNFKDAEGKIDWERYASALLIGIFGGGTGVNLYKNRKTG